MAGNKVGRVADKVAFITGAARGQGREHAIRLAEEGADIIAVDVCEDIDGVGYPGASEADLADTADLVEKSGRRIVTVKADVRDLESLRAALEQGVATLGALDIVVANAGISGIPAPAALIEQSALADDARYQRDGRVAHRQSGAAAHDQRQRIDHLGQLDVGPSRRRLYGPLRVGKTCRRRVDELAGE